MQHHLRIRLGDYEFEASGSVEQVRADRDSWYERHFGQAAAAGIPAAAAPSLPAGEGAASAPPAASGMLPNEVPAGWWERVYKYDEAKQQVSLLLRPQSGDHQVADAIILILFGVLRLAKLDPAPSSKVTAGLRQSGYQVKRVDRELGPINHMIQKGGAGRSTKYSLNNVGVDHALQLLRDMNQ